MTTALYRRYRPETFEDVIGQEHVTDPLMTALRKNRVNHAYLFSGPRGCGKTTSARILARCLNCAEGPTATPCGRCASCQDLARDGAGSLDVIEMDAASHGGVDHARDLRERATFAPVRDRYKIFIIDEAHMVTREGFNALLKIVEEPPEHVKFIFATTEPSKVLTTIRSRTHHYPFRLVPPEPLMRYLEQLCQEEGVTTEPGVLSLVVRAGGGSVRDSLSVLDQLMAGSDERGLTYDLAVALLGYTHAALLDDVVDAFAAGDAATVFSSVDRVIQTGQDPRRFVEDLLERFRDLVVVNAVPDSAANILHGMPTDQINRLRNQATQLGAGELSRSADIINEALNEMTGATSPQLHLELLCARILLPSADDSTRGITSRVDRLERRLSIPRGAGIRYPAPAAQPAPESPVEDPASGPSAIAPAAPTTSEAPARESADPAPSGPVRQDGSEPGRSTMATPDIAEPSIPEDEAEDPRGSEHPVAGSPVPEDARGPQGGHPPADGTTTAADAATQDRPAPNVPAVSPAPEEHERPTDSRSVGSEPVAEESRSRGQHRDPASGAPGGPAAERGDAQRRSREDAGTQPSGSADASADSAPSDVTSGELELLRSSWPEIVSALAEIRRVAWAITVRGTPISYENSTLRIAFEGDGDIMNFPRFEGDVRTAIQRVVGLDCAVEAVRPGDTHGRDSGGDAGGPPPGSGRGPGGGRGPAPRHPGRPPGTSNAPSQEQPDYFREPEGFGVNRRRDSTSQPSDDTSGPPARTPRQSGQDRDEGQSRAQPADRARQRPQSPAPPSPEDDEPVTSWTVAAIPQPGETARPAENNRDTGQGGERAAEPSGEPAPEGADATPSADPGEFDAPGAPEGSPDPAGSAVSSVSQGAAATDPASGERPGPQDAPTGGPSSGSPDAATHDGQGSRGPGNGDGPRATAPGDRDPGGAASASPAPHRQADRGPEYWSPEEPPPPPEDEPPADMYDEPAPSSPPRPDAAQSPAAAGEKRRGWRERHAAAIAAADQQNPDMAPPSTRGPGVEDEHFVPGADDESLEDSSLYGRAAIERILGGMLIDERAHDTSQ
ncbi:DNA polymerase III subunit gamma and tau [Kocuria tytonis]|uniref:DNA-directed DNA polymerase n=1 Tax=Kocuria tytonis TaxID=2054280 RepID=A0A495A6W2_9MICC|nr:DNA polymerase III subunit gamma and tau [Kocuria tytonis]RKQ34936.1 DNA polymerase III subunit gamma and tau [Kocuria tytonis]